MGLSYFNSKNWRDITREERYFCATAYNYFYKAPKESIKWINEKCNLGLDSAKLNANWDIGYEVALYRDFIHFTGGIFDKNRYMKRTFDLCFFSEELIVIIEAKSFSGFETVQLNDFLKDKQDIPKKISPVSVKIVPLISSKYNPKVKTLNYFDGEKLTWFDLYKKYNDDIFLRADNTYISKSK